MSTISRRLSQISSLARDIEPLIRIPSFWLYVITCILSLVFVFTSAIPAKASLSADRQESTYLSSIIPAEVGIHNEECCLIPSARQGDDFDFDPGDWTPPLDPNPYDPAIEVRWIHQADIDAGKSTPSSTPSSTREENDVIGEGAVNIWIFSEGFTDTPSNRDLFFETCQNIDFFLSTQRERVSRFNVLAVFIPSPNDGVDMGSVFSSYYAGNWMYGVYASYNANPYIQYLSSREKGDNDLLTFVMNVDQGKGSALLGVDAVIPTSSLNPGKTFAHELGHLIWLHEEYYALGTGRNRQVELAQMMGRGGPFSYPNLFFHPDYVWAEGAETGPSIPRELLPWRDLVEDEVPLPTRTVLDPYGLGITHYGFHDESLRGKVGAFSEFNVIQAPVNGSCFMNSGMAQGFCPACDEAWKMVALFFSSNMSKGAGSDFSSVSAQDLSEDVVFSVRSIDGPLAETRWYLTPPTSSGVTPLTFEEDWEIPSFRGLPEVFGSEIREMISDDGDYLLTVKTKDPLADDILYNPYDPSRHFPNQDWLEREGIPVGPLEDFVDDKVSWLIKPAEEEPDYISRIIVESESSYASHFPDSPALRLNQEFEWQDDGEELWVIAHYSYDEGERDSIPFLIALPDIQMENRSEFWQINSYQPLHFGSPSIFSPGDQYGEGFAIFFTVAVPSERVDRSQAINDLFVTADIPGYGEFALRFWLNRSDDPTLPTPTPMPTATPTPTPREVVPVSGVSLTSVEDSLVATWQHPGEVDGFSVHLYFSADDPSVPTGPGYFKWSRSISSSEREFVFPPIDIGWHRAVIFALVGDRNSVPVSAVDRWPAVEEIPTPTPTPTPPPIPTATPTPPPPPPTPTPTPLPPAPTPTPEPAEEIIPILPDTMEGLNDYSKDNARVEEDSIILSTQSGQVVTVQSSEAIPILSSLPAFLSVEAEIVEGSGIIFAALVNYNNGDLNVSALPSYSLGMSGWVHSILSAGEVWVLIQIFADGEEDFSVEFKNAELSFQNPDESDSDIPPFFSDLQMIGGGLRDDNPRGSGYLIGGELILSTADDEVSTVETASHLEVVPGWHSLSVSATGDNSATFWLAGIDYSGSMNVTQVTPSATDQSVSVIAPVSGRLKILLQSAGDGSVTIK